MSINWPIADNPAPRLVALPPGAASLDEAHAAIELWEHYKGRPLDPGQRLDVCLALATRDDGLWAAPVTGHEKPRQSGKGDTIEVVELWGLTQRSERILHTIHDAVLLATETQSRMLSLLEGHPDLRRLKLREWKGTGQQMIEMRSGAIIWYRTRTGGGGRGIDEVDRVVVDEAQHAEAVHLRSITPTQAVSANPQLNALGTGALDGKSAWWWSLRKQAKARAGAIGWAGWSAQEWDVDAKGNVILHDVDPYNRDLWWATIPGLVAGRTSIDFLEREFMILGPEGFAQEYLCVWARPDGDEADRAITADVWESNHVAGSKVESNDCWAISVSPDRKWASIGLAGRSDTSREHLEVLMRRPGTDWLVDQCVEIWDRKHIPVRVHRSAPEASFIAELAERGVEVVEVSTADVARATGRLIDLANACRLAHLGQKSLDVALAAAVLRPGSDGAAIWSALKSSVEITPLTAVTVALGGVGQASPPEFVSLVL